MRTNVIGGLNVLLLLFSIVVCVIGVYSMTVAFMEEYSNVTHHMADESTTFVKGDHIDDYLEGKRMNEYAFSKKLLDTACHKLNVSLIYVIDVDTDDYESFVSVFNCVNNSVDNSKYTEWKIGSVHDVSTDEYKDMYRRLYEKQSRFETVFRLHPDDGSHPHLTTLVPVMDNNEAVCSVLCIQRPLREMTDAFKPYFSFIILNVVISMLLISFLASKFLTNSILSPVEKVSKEASRFAREHTRGEPLGEISRHNEILELSRSIDAMEADMVKYLDDIVTITAERERVASELIIAAEIQNDALPDTFPAFPDRKEFDIYASMDPAREVGGDFYNFFLIDPDHLALVMADVSGKGIPGALFMMESNLVIKGRMEPGDKPSEILAETNDYLSKNNRADMFVTVWLGILEISTGHLYYANAGHEYPAICRKGGEFELMIDKHDFVLGGMEGMKYTDHELYLRKGDKLFLYTDGVPEATDKDNKMFGTDRMLDALNSDPEADPEQILENVRSHVDGFVKDAEQFDDLTMLCIRYNGPDAQ